MGAYSGIVAGSLVGRPLNDRSFISVNEQIADVNTFSQEVFAIPDTLQGSFTRLFPELPYHVWSSQQLSPSVNSTFYQGVYFQKSAAIINRSVLDLGLITAEVLYSFELFITHAYKLTVESVGIVASGTGITLPNISVGDVWRPYAEKTIELLVSQTGSSIISTSFYIKFEEDPATYYLSLSGARAGRWFFFEPNWAEGVSVERRFMTSVFSGNDMSETRKVLRDKPLRTLEADLTITNKYGAGRAWALLRDAAKQGSVHPWYPDYSRMTDAVYSDRVYCDTSYRIFQEGGLAMLVRNTGACGQVYSEVVQIATLLSDGFTTVLPATRSYSAGDSVFPAFSCYPALEGGSMALASDDKGTFNFKADEAYADTTLACENPGYAPVIRASLPLFELEVEFGESPEIGISMGGTLGPSGRGFLLATRGVPYVVQTVTALCRTKAECWDAIGFFNHLRGRGKPFWVKSELDFLSVVSSSGNTKFSVDNINELADFDYLKYVHAEDSSGAFDILQIVDRQFVAGGIEVTLEANSLVDIVSVRQAHAVRLSEDVVTEEYLTGSIMTITFTVQELQGI